MSSDHRPSRVRAAGRALRTIAIALVVAASVVSTTSGASSALIATFDLTSATSIDSTACAPGVAGMTDLGVVQPGTSAVGSSTCDVSFGSSNDTARLELFQLDGTGSAMFAAGSNGTPDVSLGPGGVENFDLPTDGSGSASFVDIAIQPDGKYVVAGTIFAGADAEDIVILRFEADGTPDPTFADNGMFHWSRPGLQSATAVIVQPDGRIVFAGVPDGYGGWSNANKQLVGRLTAAGALDPTWDGDGIREWSDGRYPSSLAMDVGGTGKVYVAGKKSGGAYVQRLTSTGALDVTFSGDGETETAIDGADTAEDVLVQPDGDVVISGEATVAFLARFNSDGALDTGFAGDGVMAIDVPNIYDTARSVKLDAGGNLITAIATGSSRIYVASITPAGVLDPTFGVAGLRETSGQGSSLDERIDVSIRPNGRIVISGVMGASFQVTQLLATGSFDTGWDGDGYLTLNPPGTGSPNGWRHALAADGSLVFTGSVAEAPGLDPALGKVTAAGALDTGFAAAGWWIEPIAQSSAAVFLTDVAIDEQLRIVVVGYASDGDGLNWFIARLRDDGTVDQTFGGTGYRVFVPEGIGSSYATSVDIDGSGRMLLTGSGQSNSGFTDMVAVRLLADGSPDPAFGGGDGSIRVAPISGGHDIMALPDGRVLLVGMYDATDDVAVVRLTAAGALDATCGSGVGYGYVAEPGTQDAFGVAVAADGRYLVTGWNDDAADDVLIARFGSTCAPDSSFGGSGLRVYATATNDEGSAIRELPDGSMQVAGFVPGPGGMRVDDQGDLDLSYDGDGFVTSSLTRPVLDEDMGMTIFADGSMLVGGFSVTNIAVARHRSSGALDTTFSGDGIATIPAVVQRGFGAVAEDTVGRVVLVGTTAGLFGHFNAGTGVVARFAGGAPIPNYDNGGGVDWSSSAQSMFGVCLDDVNVGTTNPVWSVDPDTCTAVDTDPWVDIPALPGAASRVATTAAGQTGGHVGLRFGIRVAVDQAPGRYYAPLAFQVVAPGV